MHHPDLELDHSTQVYAAMFNSNSVNRCFRPHAREGNALFGHVCNITLRELQIVLLFKDVFKRLTDIDSNSKFKMN